MRCNECGKHFVLLTQHVRKKHGMTRSDYCLKWNLPLSQALADDELRGHQSQKAKERLLTEEGQRHLASILIKSRISPIYGGPGVRTLPPCSLKHAITQAAVNASNQHDRSLKKLTSLMKDWNKNMRLSEIGSRHNISPNTLISYVRLGILPPRKRFSPPPESWEVFSKWWIGKHQTTEHLAKRVASNLATRKNKETVDASERKDGTEEEPK